MTSNSAVYLNQHSDEVDSLMEAGNGNVTNDQRRSVWSSARVVVKTSLFIAIAIAAVVAVSSLAQPATHTTASYAGILTLDEVANKDVALVQKAYAAWGAGKFVGKGAKDEMKMFFADDVVFDWSGDIEAKDYAKDIFNVFKGIDEVVQAQGLIAKTFKMEGTKLHFFGGRPGQVFVSLSSKMSGVLTGVSTMAAEEQEYTINDGKITKSKAYFDDPLAIQEILDPKSPLAVVKAVMAAWSTGKSYDDLLSEDVVFDATVDNVGPSPFKVYHGIDGANKWNTFLGTECVMKNIKVTFNVDMNDKRIVYTHMTGDWAAKKDSSVLGHINAINENTVQDGKLIHQKIFWGDTKGIEAFAKLLA